MSASTHHVRRLRLRAPNPTLVGRARTVLEDALRVATLPGADARVIVIRRLQLSAFKPNTSSQSLSLEIERLIAALGSELVHAESPGAATAAAVWFRDALQAHTLFAVRLLEGPPPLQWYWSAAVPAVRAHADVFDQLRVITLSLARLPEALVAVPNFLRHLVSRGHERAVLASLSESDFAVLLAACSVSAAVRDDSRRRDSLTVVRSNVTAKRRVDDPRSVSLQTLLELGVTHDRKAPARLIAEEQHTPSSSLEPSPPAAQSSSRGSARRETDVPSTQRALQEPPIVAATSARSNPEQALEQSLADSESNVSAEAAYSFTAERDETTAGGLLFVLTLLMRMGYVQWLEASPQWQSKQIERRVLRRVCEQLRVSADDVAWRLTDAPSLPSPAMSGGGQEHQTQAVELQFSPSSTPPPPPVAGGGLGWGQRSKQTDQTITRAWSISIHRWLRLHTSLTLRTLVMRPAHISLTPTHVDVHFNLADTDIAIRRAALDLTPGWLPWYGRVVSFHYECNG